MAAILKPGENCCGIKSITSPRLIVDGRDYYRAFYYSALKARRHIVISGWQFDSDTELLRGKDAHGAPAPTRFLDFLNYLCERNTGLCVYMLCWDFSLVFALEREWMQEWVFNWSSNERVFFRFDDRHAIGASQHQKFIAIDGTVAFIGGMDICAGRWDDRSHRAANPGRRNRDGEAYGPYHDIQISFAGPLVVDITENFAGRWEKITGSGIDLSPVKGARPERYFQHHAPALAIRARTAALSRTHPKTLTTIRSSVQEIRRLYIDAIESAESYIYIENQYMSSYAVFQALSKRMREAGRPGVDIMIILPRGPHKLVEEISVGFTQTKLLNALRAAAKESESRLGVYYTSAFTADGSEAPVFIHSKLMLVDDRFMTIGSANTTNRSMGLDNELNISIEASRGADGALEKSLREIRLDLLKEHCGLEEREALCLNEPGQLVENLDRIAQSRIYRLQRHKGAQGNNRDWITRLDEMFFDPEKALIEENLFEMFSPDINSLFAGGITLLRKWLRERKKAG